MRRFWYMLAHYHGQVWNASELSRSLGESYATVKRHLDMLTGALMVRQLPPWFENLGKRQVKAPKVYLRDPGILHSLLGLSTFAQLEANPKRGSSWEGFVIEHILRLVGDRNAYYWATHAGAELDLMLLVGGRRYGVEVKYSDAPALTKSMHVAITDLRLERLFVVYPGTETYRLSEKAEVVPLRDIRKRFERGPAGRTTRLRWHITGAW